MTIISPPFILLAMALLLKERTYRVVLTHFVFCILGFSIVLVLIGSFNYLISGDFRIMNAQGGYGLWFLSERMPVFEGHFHEDFFDWSGLWNQRGIELFEKFSGVEYSLKEFHRASGVVNDRFMQTAVENIIENPSPYIDNIMHQIYLIMTYNEPIWTDMYFRKRAGNFNEPTKVYEHLSSAIMITKISSTLYIITFWSSGFFILAKRDNFGLALCVVLALFVVAHSVVLLTPRYMYPIEVGKFLVIVRGVFLFVRSAWPNGVVDRWNGVFYFVLAVGLAYTSALVVSASIFWWFAITGGSLV
jgi:hypothetical protein